MRSVVQELRARLRGEHGFALPVTLAVLVGAFGLASAAAVAAINTQHGSVRDQGSKTAFAAADAGLQQAIVDYNLIPTMSSARCLVMGVGGELTQVAPQANGWCAGVNGSIGEATFVYQVRHTWGSGLEIVSTGTSRGVDRRVEATATITTGAPVFQNAGVIGVNGISLDSNATITGDAATNGNVTIASNSSICGNVSHGIGGDILPPGTTAHQCGDELEAPLTLPPVTQGDAATNNSNARLTTGEDLRTGRAIDWDPAGRTLTVNSNSTLTLGGQLPYSLCRLVMRSNSSLYVAAGTETRIFFDAPENCPTVLETPAVQLEMTGNSRIAPTSGDPSHLALLFVGSDVRDTRISLNSNTQVDSDCEQAFVIYAPKTDVDFDSNSVYCGAVAGRTVHMDSNAHLLTDPRAQEFVLPGVAPHFAVDRFVECGSAPGATPDEGC